MSVLPVPTSREALSLYRPSVKMIMGVGSRSAEMAFNPNMPPTPTSPSFLHRHLSADSASDISTRSHGLARLAPVSLPATPPHSPATTSNTSLVEHHIAERHLLSHGIHEAILVMLRRMGIPVPEPRGYEPPLFWQVEDASNTLVSHDQPGGGLLVHWPSRPRLTPDMDSTRTLITAHEPGMTLAEAWPAFSPQQKQFVRAQLAAMFRTLRAIRPAAGPLWTPHSFPALPVRDRFWLRQTTSQPRQEFDPGNPDFRGRYGPFASHEGFVAALAARVAAVSCFALDEEEEAEVLEAVARLAGSRGGELVFTHGNFCADNVVVGPDGRVLAVLDWSQAGFYPRYWEWAKAMLAARDDGQREGLFVAEGGLDVIEPGVSWEKELWSVEAGYDVIW